MADANPTTAEVSPNSRPRLLIIALLPSAPDDANGSGDERYTTIRFPESYQAAVDAALKAFADHIPASVKPKDVEMLCPMHSNEGALIWCTFDTADWNLVVEEVAGKMLGIRQKIGSQETKAITENLFVVGHVGLTYGKIHAGSTTWSDVKTYSNLGTCHPPIDRPKSYLEAVESVKEIIQSGLHRYIFPPQGFDFTDVEIKFHKFTSYINGEPTTHSWVDYPEEAYSDEVIWREYIPSVLNIMGFTLHPRRGLPNKSLDS